MILTLSHIQQVLFALGIDTPARLHGDILFAIQSVGDGDAGDSRIGSLLP